MKPSLSPRLFGLALFSVIAPFLGGCSVVESFTVAPTPQPVPPIPKELPPPKFNIDQGNPTGGVAQGKFEVTEIRAGDLLLMRSYIAPTPPPTPVPTAKPKPGQPTPTPTLPPTPIPVRQGDPFRLVGIIAPQKGQPGYEASIAGVAGWTTGKALDVEIDPRFPTDVDDNRLALVKFPSSAKSGDLQGKTLLLNRMMVRAGWAVVDLYSPTYFDTKDWLKDEAFARENRRGLWGMGIAVQQRVPIGVAPVQTGKGINRLSNVKVETSTRPTTGKPGEKTKTSVTVTTTTSTASKPAAP